MNNTTKRAARVAAGLPAGLSTGNSVVDRIGQMHFEGNILDHRWLSAPKMRYESGKLNINAVLVLADILYWHRPTLVRDEASGRIIEIRKKFSGSEFWKDYATWAEGLGLTKRQLQDAVSFLVAAGLIEREIRPVYVEGVQTNNLPILTPNPDAIAELTYNIPAPDGADDSGAGGVTFEREAPSVSTSGRSLSKNQGVTSKREAPTVSTGDIRESKQRASETINNSSANAENVVVDASLFFEMRAIGVSERVARQLASEKPDECRQQLEWLPMRDAKKQAATLVASIRDGWSAPEAILERERKEQQAQEAATQREQAAQKRTEEERAKAEEQARSETEGEQIDAFFAALPVEEQERINGEAQRRLGVLGGMGRAPVALMMMRRQLLRPELKLS